MRRLSATLFVGTAGCGGLLHSVEEAPEPPIIVPEAWRGEASSTSPSDARWWESFEDPRLDALLRKAFQQNLDLYQAFARLRQADAAVRGARSGFFPTISGDANGGRSKTVVNFGQGPVGFSQDQFGLTAAASYEIDLWGRVAQGYGASRKDRVAAEADVSAAAMTLAARVTDTYLELIEQRQTLKLLEAQIESSKTFLELLELRFDQGVSGGLDVFQQRQQLASTRALRPPVRARLAVLEHQLAVLVGRAPRSIDTDQAPTSLPTPPPLPELGVPAAVLLQRPDVQAAQARLVAEDHRIGVAIAERFPRVSLDASTGFRAFDLSDLFQQFVWSVGSSITAVVYDGGRLSSQVEGQRARFDELLGVYGQTVLVALREVQDALAQEAQQQELLVDLEEQRIAAEGALQEARIRYGNGLSDYLPVLTALTATQTAERSLVTAKRQLLSFRVELYRALGGTWTEGLKTPRLPGEENGETS